MNEREEVCVCVCLWETRKRNPPILRLPNYHPPKPPKSFASNLMSSPIFSLNRTYQCMQADLDPGSNEGILERFSMSCPEPYAVQIVQACVVFCECGELG